MKTHLSDDPNSHIFQVHLKTGKLLRQTCHIHQLSCDIELDFSKGSNVVLNQDDGFI